MIPAGYLAKTVASRHDLLAAAAVEDFYSVSGVFAGTEPGPFRIFAVYSPQT